jgi:hypothetical protein
VRFFESWLSVGIATRVVKAPPLTWMVWPVMCPAPGEARK